MYSQHSSEKPARTNPVNFLQKKPKLISHINSLFCSHDKGIRQSLKSVVLILTTITLFVGFVMGAYCFEGSVNFGFKPDFQNNQKSYASRNALFNADGDITMVIKIHGTDAIEVTSPLVTVGELIENNSIILSANDVLNYSEDEEIFNGMELCIDEVTTETYTQKTEIAYTTVARNTQTVPKGTTKVTQKGVNGSVVETVTETYKNGVLVETNAIADEETRVDAIDEIVETGIGGVYTDVNGVSYEYSYYMDVVATAYGTLSGVTATGKAIDFGMIAVDPSVIPLGTKVYLTGSTYGDMGVHSAEDTGGGIKGNKIDVYLGDDYNTLMQFGRRTMRIYILV